jgi:DNA-binding NarL/FixJ family response regulator
MLGDDQMRTKIRLLIIEEHRAVRRALETRLRSSPLLEVVGAIPRLADDFLNGHQSPDVALLSMKRGSLQSFDRILHLVRRLGERGTAVLILTPYADDIERELLLQAGASRYLLQNVNTPQLIAEIELANAERAKVANTTLAH